MEPVTAITTIMTALAGTDAATNLIKKLKGNPRVTKEDLDEVHNNIRQIKGDILEARIEQIKLIDENQTLKKQIKELKRWSLDKEQYEITTVSPGVQVYIKRGEDTYGIWYCPRCFDRDLLLSTVGFSKLNPSSEKSYFSYSCTCCEFDLMVTSQIHSMKMDHFRKSASQTAQKYLR